MDGRHDVALRRLGDGRHRRAVDGSDGLMEEIVGKNLGLGAA